MGKLDGKVVLATGGLSGIGRASAELFAAEGARLVLFDARAASRDDGVAGEELAGRLNGVFVQGDVREPGDVDRAVATALDAFGGLDVVCNFAGIVIFKPLAELTLDDFDQTMAVNVRGTFLTCKRAAEHMRERRTGVIVNVASNFAFVAAAQASAYCASKGAVATLTKSLALELGPYGIRANALCPGATATELNREYQSRPDVRAEWRPRLPLEMGREQFLALPPEIATAALFLACDDSKYMTGASLVVDGGWNAH